MYSSRWRQTLSFVEVQVLLIDKCDCVTVSRPVTCAQLISLYLPGKDGSVRVPSWEYCG